MIQILLTATKNNRDIKDSIWFNKLSKHYLDFKPGVKVTVMDTDTGILRDFHRYLTNKIAVYHVLLGVIIVPYFRANYHVIKKFGIYRLTLI